MCFSDPLVFQQIVNNLLSNAIQYTQKEGVICIQLKKEKEERILISVKDNGMGIPEGEKEKIFSKFFRGKNAKNLVPEGSGLGLVFVKRLVEALKGRVWFESPVEWKKSDGTVEKKGTCFYVEIPLVPPKNLD